MVAKGSVRGNKIKLPVATVAYYGPDDKVSTKVAVGIIERLGKIRVAVVMFTIVIISVAVIGRIELLHDNPRAHIDPAEFSRESLELWAKATVLSAGSCNGSGVPYPVDFSGEAGGGAPPYNYTWNFRDGSPPVHLASPWHNYTHIFPPFNASLEVNDSAGNHAWSNVTIPHIECPVTKVPSSPSDAVLYGTVVVVVAFAVVGVIVVMTRWKKHEPRL